MRAAPGLILAAAKTRKLSLDALLIGDEITEIGTGCAFGSLLNTFLRPPISVVLASMGGDALTMKEALTFDTRCDRQYTVTGSN